MESAAPLDRFAQLLYRDEAATAARAERMSQFLAGAPQSLEKIRNVIGDVAATDRYAAVHAVRFVDQVRAVAALRSRSPEHPYRVLDIGVASVTPLYAKVIDGIALETAGLPWSTPAEATARRYGSSAHHYIDLEEESFPETLPELRGKFDAVIFCEILEHIRASPQELIEELIWLLRPNGHLIISTPNALNRGWVIRLMTGRKMDPVHTRAMRKAQSGRDFYVREYTPIELREAVAAAAGEVVEEGLFDWFSDQTGRLLPQVSARQSIMLIVRRKG